MYQAMNNKMTHPRTSLADQAYDALKRDILTCVLDPGTQLAQADLTARYNLGTTPIREALKRLEMEGYVQAIPRFGTLITPITIEDINEIYEMRLILEKSAARLAAERATDAQIEELTRQANFTYTFGDSQSYLEFLDHNTDFHSRVASLSGNRRLQDAIAHLLDTMKRIFHIGLDLRDSAEEMRAEHIQLVGALQKRDAGLAEQIVEDQIFRSRERVVEMLNQRLSVRSEVTFTRTKQE